MHPAEPTTDCVLRVLVRGSFGKTKTTWQLSVPRRERPLLSKLPSGFGADPVEGSILTDVNSVARLDAQGKEIPSRERITGPSALKQHGQSSFRLSEARSSSTASERCLIIEAPFLNSHPPQLGKAASLKGSETHRQEVPENLDGHRVI